MTTGIVVPMSFAVWALNALTNSMMLMPCWPRAGPTGGAGEAWPPGACSLMVVRTFLAIVFLNLLDLVEAHFDRGLASKDRDQHLEPARVLVDLGDLAGEIGQRAGDDLDGLADRVRRLLALALGDLAMQQPVDLGLGERHRLVRRADEPGDARRVLHDHPGVLVEVHVH